VIKVEFSGASNFEAKKISSSLVNVVKEKVQALNEASGKIAYGILSTEPLIAKNPPEILLDSAVAFLAGILIFSMSAFVWEYFKQ